MEIIEIKKYLKKEVEAMGDKIKFGKITPIRLYAEIKREDGKIDKVYWILNNEGLASLWYYTL